MINYSITYYNNIYTHIRTHIYIYIFVCVYIYIYIYTPIDIYIYTYVSAYLSLSIYLSLSLCICMYVCIYIYIYIHGRYTTTCFNDLLLNYTVAIQLSIRTFVIQVYVIVNSHILLQFDQSGVTIQKVLKQSKFNTLTMSGRQIYLGTLI